MGAFVMSQTNSPTPKRKPDEFENQGSMLLWLKRLGLAGFLFFAIKGMLWILIPVLVARGCLVQ